MSSESGPSAKRAKSSAETIKQLYLDKETADVFFVFDVDKVRTKVPAHKNILAKRSKVFHAKFYGESKETGDEVEIKDASIDEFKAFLKFLYSDDATITEGNVSKMMYLADTYDVTEFMGTCNEFISKNLPIEKILFGYDLAALYDQFELKVNLEEKISENAKDIFAGDEFRGCTRETLKRILDIDQLMCDLKNVFDACIDWAENTRGRKSIKKQLGESFYQIPFYLMTSEQVFEIVSNNKELFNRDEVIELMSLMKSSGKNTLNKFKYKDGYAPYSNAKWCWWWNTKIKDEHKQWINRREVVQLRYDNKNVLKALKPTFIWHMDEAGYKMLCGAMKIMEKATAEAEEKVLVKQTIQICCHTVSCTMQTIKFVKPFVMEPNKYYEIQFDFDDSWSEKMFYMMQTGGENTEITPMFCFNIL